MQTIEGKFKKEFCFFFVCYIWRFFIMLQYQKAEPILLKILCNQTKNEEKPFSTCLFNLFCRFSGAHYYATNDVADLQKILLIFMRVPAKMYLLYKPKHGYLYKRAHYTQNAHHTSLCLQLHITCMFKMWTSNVDVRAIYGGGI